MALERRQLACSKRSRVDAARNGYVLMTHHGGVTSIVPVQPRGVPFDADLGPDENIGPRRLVPTTIR